MAIAVRARIVIPIVLAAPLVLFSLCSAATGDVAVRLELSQQFYYEGDALELRVTVHNPHDKNLSNPIESPLFAGFKVRSEGQLLEPAGRASAEEPSRPDKLAPDSFYGAVVNMVELFPRLAVAGTYQIFWNADGVVSDMIVVTIIPRYDPTKEYVCEVETDHGTIVIDLFSKSSPIAVKSFVDMAQARFYDGLRFHEVRADHYIVGGDPRSVGREQPSIQYPAELSSLPLVAGTVVMRPVRAVPPSNGSTFVILLRPQPSWQGQVTPLGQVVRGLDVVQRLSRTPSTGLNTKPNFKPLQELEIKRVTIHEKPARTPAK